MQLAHHHLYLLLILILLVNTTLIDPLLSTVITVINYEGFLITARFIKKKGFLILNYIINSVNNSNSHMVLTNVKPSEILIDHGRIDNITSFITDIRIRFGVVNVKVF